MPKRSGVPTDSLCCPRAEVSEQVAESEKFSNTTIQQCERYIAHNYSMMAILYGLVYGDSDEIKTKEAQLKILGKGSSNNFQEIIDELKKQIFDKMQEIVSGSPYLKMKDNLNTATSNTDFISDFYQAAFINAETIDPAKIEAKRSEIIKHLSRELSDNSWHKKSKDAKVLIEENKIKGFFANIIPYNRHHFYKTYLSDKANTEIKKIFADNRLGLTKLFCNTDSTTNPDKNSCLEGNDDINNLKTITILPG